METPTCLQVPCKKDAVSGGLEADTQLDETKKAVWSGVGTLTCSSELSEAGQVGDWVWGGAGTAPGTVGI